jgi:hypothetical protein
LTIKFASPVVVNHRLSSPKDFGSDLTTATVIDLNDQ